MKMCTRCGSLDLSVKKVVPSGLTFNSEVFTSKWIPFSRLRAAFGFNWFLRLLETPIRPCESVRAKRAFTSRVSRVGAPLKVCNPVFLQFGGIGVFVKAPKSDPRFRV